MSPEDFSNSVMRLAETLIKELPIINEKAALNAYAMMKNRITEEGTIGENKSLGGYSDNPLPAFFFKDKAENDQGEAAYLKAKKSGEGISYKKWREANNRLTDHKRLSFTGTTLNDIGVIKSLVNGTKVITSVGAKNTKTRKDDKSTSEIMNYLGDQVGDFLSPNTHEQQITEQFINKEVYKIIKKTFK